MKMIRKEVSKSCIHKKRSLPRLLFLFFYTFYNFSESEIFCNSQTSKSSDNKIKRNKNKEYFRVCHEEYSERIYIVEHETKHRYDNSSKDMFFVFSKFFWSYDSDKFFSHDKEESNVEDIIYRYINEFKIAQRLIKQHKYEQIYDSYKRYFWSI